MIYCCGLRPVEARRLRREDVNLFDGTVNILESKGHKDRIVVLSEDMLELCRNYDLRVEKIYPHRKYFFQSPSVRGDGMYSMEWIIPTFRRFLQTAGISGYGEIRPRLYDLRHTFATHRLYQWVKEGKDINACLAYLSEYRQMKGKKKFWLIFSVAAVVLFVWIIRYKAINQDYRQRWSANTEKTYSVGEIVPIAPDFVGYNLAAEGYMLQVNRFEIVDYRAYTSALQYDGTDRSRIPDKIALVSVTVSQQNSSAEGFPLTELSLYTTDMLMNMDWDLLGVVNPILDGATGIRLQDGASCDILLPFDLYRYRFTSSEWNGLEQSSIWLQVTNYPTRKIIQVNIGEE